MQQKKRPCSSKPISSIPIIIDQSKSQHNSDYDIKPSQSRQYSNAQQGNVCDQAQGKMRLNHIIPELPHFGIKGNSTALLYSKFVVKGLRDDKISIVKSAFRKKEEKTEAATLCNNKNKSINTIPRLQTGEMLDNFIGDDLTVENSGSGQLNTLLRANSAKVFRKPVPKQQATGQNQPKLSKNRTQLNLHRPQSKKRPTTAKLSREKDIRFSHGLAHEPQNSNQLKQSKKQRPTTASNGRQTQMYTIQGGIEKSMVWADQLSGLVGNKIKDKPIRIQTIPNIDHIQRNKQNISSYTRKTSSIYLTNANVEQLMKRKASSRQTQMKRQETVQSKRDTSLQIQLKPQQIFSQTDKKTHQKNLQKISQYLQQSLPSKLQLITQQLRKEYRKTHTQQQNQNYQQLLSMNLDNGFEDNHSELNQRSAKACFDQYIQHCQILQYNISAKLKSEQLKENGRSTLNICQCQRVIQVYNQLVQTQDQASRSAKIDEIRQLTKNLKYFSLKPKQQIDKFFTIPFQILISNQHQVLIQLNSPVTYIYIILNGSALMQSNSHHEYDLPSRNFGQKLLNTQHSLYDGEIFGEPSKPSEKYYRVRVTMLEQSLLMRVRYEDYVGRFFQGSEVQEKLDVLNAAFKLEVIRGLLTEQDLEIISLSLQRHRYPSKSLIYRQDETFDKLVLVSKGKLAAINEFILQHQKTRSSDMKQLDKNIRQHKQNTQINEPRKSPSTNNWTEPQLQVDKLSVSRMRRENLINYEVLREDGKKKMYYFMKEMKEFVKGDSVNWGALIGDKPDKGDNGDNGDNGDRGIEEDILGLGVGMASIKPVTFSLMSNSNDTQVYFLSRNAFQYLPNNIKKILQSKGQQQQLQQLKPQSEQQLKTWNSYKQKLCTSIIKEGKQRKNKNKF